MRNYTLFTAVVPFTTNEQPVPIILEVPNNAVPLQTEYRSTGQAFHFLVPCDDNGLPVEEVITPNIYEIAWGELHELFGERSEQDNLDAMDSVLKGVIAKRENDVEAKGEEEELNINHKGQQCLLNKDLFCQEGWCSGCQIYLSRNEIPGSV